MEIAIRISPLVEFYQRPVLEHLVNERSVFLVGAVAPYNAVRYRPTGNFIDPSHEVFVDTANLRSLQCQQRNDTTVVRYGINVVSAGEGQGVTHQMPFLCVAQNSGSNRLRRSSRSPTPRDAATIAQVTVDHEFSLNIGPNRLRTFLTSSPLNLHGSFSTITGFILHLHSSHDWNRGLSATF